MDLTLRTETFSQDDQRWLVSDHGADTGRTVTLDVSKFTQADHYPDGYLKSGIVIAQYSSGKYGPYDPNVNTGDGSNAGATGATDKVVRVGFLLEAVQVRSGATAVAGSMVLHCFVDKSKLPVTTVTKKGAVSVDNGTTTYAAKLPAVVFV
jgi:hypothetical protein